jgi:MFS family permease
MFAKCLFFMLDWALLLQIKDVYLSVRLVTSLFALFFSLALLVVGNGFLMTLVSVRLSLASVEPQLIGSMMVSYSAGFVLGTLYVSGIVQQAGHIRAFAVFCAILALASLCYPLSGGLWLWALLRVIGGFAMAGLLITTESWFSGVATNQNRATIFSFYLICFYMATSTGQLLIMVGSPDNDFVFSLAAGLFIAALIPLGLTRMQAPTLENVERLSLKKIYAVSPLGVIATFVSGVIVASFYGVGPLFATLIGFSVDQIAWFMALAIFAAMLFAWPIGWLCDRINRARMLLYIAGVGALCSLMLCFEMTSAVMVTLVNAVMMAMVAALYPVGVALTTDRLSSAQMLSASATLLLSYGVGSCLGPVISATLIEVVGVRGMYVGISLLMLMLGVYAYYRLGKGRTVDIDQQEPFVPLNPGTSPVINELNPLNENFVDGVSAEDRSI